MEKTRIENEYVKEQMRIIEGENMSYKEIMVQMKQMKEENEKLMQMQMMQQMAEMEANCHGCKVYKNDNQ